MTQANQFTDRVRQSCERGDWSSATTEALERFGPEIRRFVLGMTRDPSDAAEVYAQFTEDFWRGLPGFDWRCPLRAWTYTLARNATIRLLRSPHRRAARNVDFDSLCESQMHAAEPRFPTPPYQKTATKRRVRALWSGLSENDQRILELRIDERRSWLDVARVLAPDSSDLSREATRLRKRFQLIKRRLRTLAIERGVVAMSS